MKSILGIINSSPTGSSNSHEAIEMLMVYAAFDFEVSILLRGSAVLHLQKDQQPEVLKIKNHSALLKALDLYDVKNLYVDEKAMAAYQCQADEDIHFELINSQSIIDHIAQHSEVLNF
jgi:tRNA 2-thiouridine synthesizing protein C